MKTNTIETATRAIGKVKLSVIKHSPEILLVVGVVGAVAGVVTACKATRKLDTVLEEHNKAINDIKTVSEDTSFCEENNYTENDKSKDLMITYSRTAVQLIKLYGPSIAIEAASITCILASNNILRKRNAAISAAYTTVFNSFREYRKRVAERYGDEIEKQIRYNIKAEEIRKTVTDENGNEKEVTETALSYDPNNFNDYVRIFDETTSKAYDRDPDYNLVFLRSQQAIANNKLKRDGYLFLNDVLDALGFDRTKYGQIVGWRYDEKNPTGDNYVDFGMYNVAIPENVAFINGKSNKVILEFNVDGDILSSM